MFLIINALMKNISAVANSWHELNLLLLIMATIP
jgi:hypothetical protein